MGHPVNFLCKHFSNIRRTIVLTQEAYSDHPYLEMIIGGGLITKQSNSYVESIHFCWH